MVEVKQISKSFNNEAVISDFSIQVKKGDFVAITGESGKGKTTILNMMGLLEKPDSGEVVVDGIVNPSKKDILLIKRHKFAYLFQNYALIEDESVEENLKIALEYQKGVNKKSSMLEALRFVNLNGSFLEKKSTNYLGVNSNV